MRLMSKPRPVPEVQFSSTERTRCISRSDPVLTICAPPRGPRRNFAETNFAMSSTFDVMPVAAAMPRASTNGSTSRVPSGIRRPYGTASPGTFLSTLDAVMPSGLKMLRST